MQAVINTCSDVFMEKILTQSGLVLETQFYPSSIPLGANQEETSLVFWLPTKYITVLKLRYPSGIQ